MEAKNQHSKSLQSTKMWLESESCGDHICVAMLGTIQTIAKDASLEQANWGNIWKAIQMQTMQF